jgi:hypothetical protein
MPDSYRPAVGLVRDTHSFGLAYLAEGWRQAEPAFVPLDNFHPPFAKAKFRAYQTEVGRLSEALESLPYRHMILEEPIASPWIAAGNGILSKKNELKIENIAGNKAAFTVSCHEPPCFLVFNTAALSGWKAYADQQRIRVQRANYAFVAVESPPGKHLIWMEHRRPSSFWGYVITLFGSLFMMYGVLHRPAIRIRVKERWPRRRPRPYGRPMMVEPA